VWLGVYWPIVFVYSRVIKEVASAHRKKDLPAILFLNHIRFRKDVEVLANTGEFRVLIIPEIWQARILTQFYPRGVTKTQIFFPEKYVEVVEAKRRLHDFLRNFLPHLYRILGIRCVVGASFFYSKDHDWGTISDEIGVPYVLIPRENYALETPDHIRYKDKDNYYELKNISFSGSMIICQNESLRDFFIDFGIVTPQRIIALGCLRMDEFIRNVKSYKKNVSKRKKVVFFSFTLGANLKGHPDHVAYFVNVHWPSKPDVGWAKLFESTHSAYAKLAMKRPDVDFIFKPKWLGKWKDNIEEAISNQGIDIQRITNLYFTEEDAGNLILDSDVVCGFGSNTIIEAGFARKPVIIPMYYEANRRDYAEYIHFHNYYHIFDIAESEKAFVNLIEEKLSNPIVDKELMKEREALFKYDFLSTKPDAAMKYTKVIKDVIRRNYALTS